MKNAQLFYWSIVLAFLFGFYLKSHRSYPEKNQVSQRSFFTPPKIGLDIDSAYVKTMLAYSKKRAPVLLGKSVYKDTVFVKPEWFTEFANQKHYCPLDSLEYYIADGLQLLTHLEVDFSSAHFSHSPDQQLLPLFIVNETSQPKVLMRYGGVLNISVEAKNHSGIWEQIGGSRDSGGYLTSSAPWQIKILPGEFAFSLLSIPTGDFSTQIRLKLINGDNIIVSRPFGFNMDYSAFQIFEAQL
ncbi:MAG: hypothetical protein KTR30_29465 [Saprospiraceae bacterium]|nr:hypothetical protein [Saprospiraceae bacterium]